ncbi:HNH endonuclease [Nocardia thailandica]
MRTSTSRVGNVKPRLERREARQAAGEPAVCVQCDGDINYDQGFSGLCQDCRERLRYIPKLLRSALLASGARCGAAATCIDHVRPIACGGDSSPENLEPCCADCNLDKNCHPIARWFAGPDSTPIGRRAMAFSLARSAKVAESGRG